MLFTGASPGFEREDMLVNINLVEYKQVREL